MLLAFVYGEIVDVQVGGNSGEDVFLPSTVNINVGDTIIINNNGTIKKFITNVINNLADGISATSDSTRETAAQATARLNTWMTGTMGKGHIQSPTRVRRTSCASQHMRTLPRVIVSTKRTGIQRKIHRDNSH